MTGFCSLTIILLVITRRPSVPPISRWTLRFFQLHQLRRHGSYLLVQPADVSFAEVAFQERVLLVHLPQMLHRDLEVGEAVKTYLMELVL